MYDRYGPGPGYWMLAVSLDIELPDELDFCGLLLDIENADAGFLAFNGY